MEANFDLFGHPVREGFGKRGRPPYEPTEKDRNKVKLLLALGWTSERIGNALGVSGKTVARYFSPELKARDVMRDALTARRFEIAMEQANAGNIAALKELGAMIERNDRMLAEDVMGSRGREDERAQPTAPVGKKAIDEQRAMAADADLMAELESEAAQNVGHC